MTTSLPVLDDLIRLVSASLPNQPASNAMAAEPKKYENVYSGGQAPLKQVDPDIYAIIKAEEERQRCGLELIASENFTSRAVMEAVGSCLTNKYSEGLPNKRYYGGNIVIDRLEILCQKRALEVFNLDPSEWGVNVQPYSGSTANFAAMSGLLGSGDRMMGLYLPDGGHLSHGFYRGHKAINISAKYFQSLPYHINPETGYIDYDDLEKTAARFAPKLIVGGSSAYPRDWDYKRMRTICDNVNAKLLVDMAHFSGLVATKQMNNPFEFADVVTTTTHKSLRATRAAMIFYRKELEKDMNYAVFPGTQGGPHNHAIAGIAVALREALAPEFTDYCVQIVKNCRTLAAELSTMGHKIATDGTDCHLLLWDLRPHGVSGSKVEWICDEAHITINKNTVHGDKSALSPGGVRIGTPALTSRGFKEEDFKYVGKLLDESCRIAIEVQKKAGSKKLVDFKKAAAGNPAIEALRKKVQEFSSKFPIPGKILD